MDGKTTKGRIFQVIITQGVHTYKLPEPIGLFHSCWLWDGFYLVELMYINPERISTLDKYDCGKPESMSLMNDEIIIYPTPDNDYELLIKFNPPMKLI